MVISRVLKNYCQNNAAAKRAKNVNSAEKAAQKEGSQKDPLEEYLEKWAQEKEIQQKALDERIAKQKQEGRGAV